MSPSLPTYTDPNFPDPGSNADANIVIYGYTPNFALAVIGCVFFSLCLLGGLAVFARLKRWDSVTFLLCLGTTCEVVGYVFRALSAKKDPYRINFYVVQYFMIVVAPVFYAASIYIALGRLVRVAGRKVSPLGHKAILAIFLSFDVVTIIMQVAGAGWIGAAESSADGGKNPDVTVPSDLLIAGLAFQTFSFSAYFIVWTIVTWNLLRLCKSSRQTAASPAASSRHLLPYARNLALLLGLVSLFVQIRTIFRLAESAQGFFAYLDVHEIFFALLECFPIMLAMLGLVPLAFFSRDLLNKHLASSTVPTNPTDSTSSRADVELAQPSSDKAPTTLM